MRALAVRLAGLWGKTPGEILDGHWAVELIDYMGWLALFDRQEQRATQDRIAAQKAGNLKRF